MHQRKWRISIVWEQYSTAINNYSQCIRPRGWAILPGCLSTITLQPSLLKPSIECQTWTHFSTCPTVKLIVYTVITYVQHSLINMLIRNTKVKSDCTLNFCLYHVLPINCCLSHPICFMNCCLSHLPSLQTVACSPRLLCELLLIPTVNYVNCCLNLLSSLWTIGSFTCMPDLKIVADHNSCLWTGAYPPVCAVVYPICLLCGLVLCECGLLLRFVMLCRFEINRYVTVPTLLLFAFVNL